MGRTRLGGPLTGADRLTVEAIHIAPATRLPMRAVSTVVAEAGRGLVGDRYHGSRHRHVTVQSATELAQAGDVLGHAIDPGETRRNITVSGGTIPTTPGARLRIADVELEVVRIAAPCKLLDDVIGAGARTALRRRAGSVCRVLTSGPLSVGDPVDLEAGATPS
ncbi:MAG: MOSC domain-containing protein [Acidimicrobiales bacterium]